MTCLRVLRYPDDLDAELRKVRFESSEILCFERAARSIIFRIEVEECLGRVGEEGRESHNVRHYCISSRGRANAIFICVSICSIHC